MTKPKVPRVDVIQELLAGVINDLLLLVLRQSAVLRLLVADRLPHVKALPRQPGKLRCAVQLVVKPALHRVIERARIEAAGEPGRINVSAYTYLLIQDEVKCEYRGKISAKGKGDLDMYFVAE